MAEYQNDFNQPGILLHEISIIQSGGQLLEADANTKAEM
jgi:hypothetical protein